MKSDRIKKEIIARGLFLFQVVFPFFLKKKFIIPFFFILFVLWLKPQLFVQFKSHSGPSGYGQVYEAVIDVQGGRPSGISNLFVELSFPSDLMEIKIISNGGCSDLQALKDSIIEPKGLDWKRAVSRTGRIVAKECPSGAKPIFQFTVAGTSFDDPIVNDEGAYQGEFDWYLVLKGIAIPWSAMWSTLFPSTALKGAIPAAQQETPYIATYGYPASISPPPYYDLAKRSGSIVSILDHSDYNDRLNMEKAAITSFNRPSTRLLFGFEDNGSVSGVIRNMHCQNPVVVKRKLQPVEFSNYADPEMKVCIELSWKECEADIKVYQRCRVNK